jgi:hypothetical protein
VQEGATDIARELARKPTTSLSRRAAQRPLVRYTDGSLTAGEYLRLMRQRPAQQRGQVAAAGDEQLRTGCALLARDEILIEEASPRPRHAAGGAGLGAPGDPAADRGGRP